MISVEYCRSSINSDGHVQFTHMKLLRNDNVIIMFSIVGLYDLKRLIELDATLMKYVHVTRANFIQPKTY